MAVPFCLAAATTTVFPSPAHLQAKLREFLALMPAEQREAAAQQLAALPF